MITCICESKLSSSYILSDITDKLPDQDNPVKRAVDLIKNAKHLTVNDIENLYVQLKMYNNSLSRAAIQKFENGDIILLYNDVPSRSLTQSLPFMTFKVQDRFVTYLFMDRFTTITRDGLYNIQIPILHDLLVGAAISNALYRDYSNLTSSPNLEMILMDVYNELFSRVLNREYSIGTDKRIFETAKYYINKFFLLNVFGTIATNESIEQSALRNLTHLSGIDITNIQNRWTTANPSNIKDLLTLLSEVSPRMQTINMSSLIGKWLEMYYPPALFSLDTIEYVIFVTLTVLNGTNIVNIGAGDSIKDVKNIKSIREELLKLMQ